MLHHRKLKPQKHHSSPSCFCIHMYIQSVKCLSKYHAHKHDEDIHSWDTYLHLCIHTYTHAYTRTHTSHTQTYIHAYMIIHSRILKLPSKMITNHHWQFASSSNGILASQPLPFAPLKGQLVKQRNAGKVVAMATIPARVPDMGKRQLLNLLLLGAVSLPAAGALGPYLLFFVPPRYCIGLIQCVVHCLLYQYRVLMFALNIL